MQRKTRLFIQKYVCKCSLTPYNTVYILVRKNDVEYIIIDKCHKTPQTKQPSGSHYEIAIKTTSGTPHRDLFKTKDKYHYLSYHCN